MFSELSARAIIGLPWALRGRNVKYQIHVSSFPLVQILVSHGRDAVLLPGLETIFLGDGLIGPERCVTGILNYIEAQGTPIDEKAGSALLAAMAFATAPISLGSTNTHGISMIPAEAYMFGAIALQYETSISCPICNLEPGQFTALVNFDGFVKYCFVRPKVRIHADVNWDDIMCVTPGDIDVMDARAFLEETAPWADVTKLEAQIAKTQQHVAAVHRKEAPASETLKVMDHEEACRHINKCIANFAKQREERDRLVTHNWRNRKSKNTMVSSEFLISSIVLLICLGPLRCC